MKKINRYKFTILTVVFLGTLSVSGCVTETSRRIETAPIQVTPAPYRGVRSTLVVGKFDNQSNYLRGIFSNKIDQLGSKAKTILITYLQQSGRFNVMDRSNLSETGFEAKLRGKKQKLKGAAYLVTGNITSFGRKQVGDKQLFGLLGRGKSQIAYAKVTLNIVDVTTSEVLHSVQGAGEYKVATREIIGTGGTASYDSTLNGKVLDLALREAVNKLVDGIDSGALNVTQ